MNERPLLRSRWAAPASTWFERAVYPDLWRGCVGAWCPSLGVQDQIIDTSGRGNHGTRAGSGGANNLPQFVIVGKGGYALDLDGTDDYFSSTVTSSITTQCTFSLWVYTSSTNHQLINYPISLGSSGSPILSMWIGGTYSDAQLKDRAIGIFSGSSGSSAIQNSFTTPDHDKWNHIAVVYDDAASPKTKIWKNGVQLSMFTNNVSGSMSAQNEIHVGRRVDAFWYWNGRLDDIRVYDRPFSDAEIHILSGFGGNEALGRGIAYRTIPDQVFKSPPADLVESSF